MDIRMFEVTEAVVTHHIYADFTTTDIEVRNLKGEVLEIQFFSKKPVEFTTQPTRDHRTLPKELA